MCVSLHVARTYALLTNDWLHIITYVLYVNNREESEEKANDSTLVYGEIHFKTFALAIEKVSE